jgi:hypothetical protein
MNFHMAKFACSQMKRGPETLQASKLTNTPNGMRSANAALIGPTMRVTCQPKKSPTTILQQMLAWVKARRK